MKNAIVISGLSLLILAALEFPSALVLACNACLNSSNTASCNLTDNVQQCYPWSSNSKLDIISVEWADPNNCCIRIAAHWHCNRALSIDAKIVKSVGSTPPNCTNGGSCLQCFGDNWENDPACELVCAGGCPSSFGVSLKLDEEAGSCYDEQDLIYREITCP